MTRNYLLAFKRALFACVLVVGSLLAAGSARAQTEALVSVSPEFQLVHLGDEFALQVRIDDVQALYGFDVLLSFPPDLLEALSVVDEGFLAPGMQWPVIDNDAGTVKVVHSQINPAEPASGSGALFTVTFRADAEGANAALLLSEVTLSDRDGLLIPCDTRGGAVRLGDYQLFLPAAFR